MPPERAHPVQLTAAATQTLPRWILLLICVLYGVAGLFGRDPWKTDDAAGFGIMWTMAQGHTLDWLIPNIAGRSDITDGPLAYWLGAPAIHFFSSWINASNASRIGTALCFFATCIFVWQGTYRLGKRVEVQPFAYAFGGQPEARDYGRALADGALLIFLACLGLAQRGHETTPEVAQMALLALLLFALIESLDHPHRGGMLGGCALGGLILAGGPVVPFALFLTSIVIAWFCRALPMRALFFMLPIMLLLGASWPLAAYLATQSGEVIGQGAQHIRAWWRYDWRFFSGPSHDALRFAIRNFWLFAWPVWPLALWSFFSWKGQRRAPHIALPLGLSLTLLLLLLLQQNSSDNLFILMMPALAVLGAFGLPTLKRSVINAMDWFALLFFTILGLLIWLFWIAKMTGIPPALARNVFRKVPGFTPEFSLVTLLIALAVTAAWALVLRWRLASAPRVIWRSVVISAAGTTLMWVLLMTLWLPTINYAKTYRDVALQMAHALPAHYRCVQPVRLGHSQLASFAYFTNIRFGHAETGCDILLRYDPVDYGEPTSISTYDWKLIWEGRRPSDRSERFRMYQLQTDRQGTSPSH